jgi:hypothetical protein
MAFYRLISSRTQLKETIIVGKSRDFYGDACFGLPNVCRVYLLFSFTVPSVYCVESAIRDRNIHSELITINPLKVGGEYMYRLF